MKNSERKGKARSVPHTYLLLLLRAIPRILRCAIAGR